MILNRVAPSKIDRASLLSLTQARMAASDLFSEWGDCIASCDQKVGPEVHKGYGLSLEIVDSIDQVDQKQLILTRTKLLVEALRFSCESAVLIRSAKKLGSISFDRVENLEYHIDNVIAEIGKVISKSGQRVGQGIAFSRTVN